MTLTTLSDGTHSTIAQATDKAGNVATSSALEFTLDRSLSAPVIDLLASSDTGRSDTDNITSDNSPTVAVRTEAGATVELFITGAPNMSTVADSEGNAVFELTGLTDRTYRLSATVSTTCSSAPTATMRYAGWRATTFSTAATATT